MGDPIEKALFAKDYIKLSQLIQSSPSSNITNPNKKIFIQYTELKIKLFEEVARFKEVNDF